MTISNQPRDYAWGSTTLLADLEGRTADGRPEAEVWFGDHPGCPALVGDGSGRTLDAVRADAEAPRLSFLLKLLAAGSPLSIQAHPSRAQAIEGFAREEAAGIPRDAGERTYRDDNHKPELIVAVSDVFRALAGLRPLEQTRLLLDGLGDAAGVRALADRLSGEDETAALRDTIQWLLSGGAQAEVDDVIEAVRGADDEAFAVELTALRGIADAYPGDPGVVVALLMNVVELRRGEAVFVDAGVLHAYLEGLGVELMAASDNVLRGGLTPKHIDVAELMTIVDTSTSAPPVLAAKPVADGVSVFDAGIADFALWHVTVSGGSTDVALNGPAIAVSTTGGVTVTAGGSAIALGAGGAVYADEAEEAVTVSGTGEVFIAQPGR